MMKPHRQQPGDHLRERGVGAGRESKGGGDKGWWKETWPFCHRFKKSMFLQNGTVLAMNATEFLVSSREQNALCGLLVEIHVEEAPHVQARGTERSAVEQQEVPPPTETGTKTLLMKWPVFPRGSKKEGEMPLTFHWRLLQVQDKNRCCIASENSHLSHHLIKYHEHQHHSHLRHV